MHTTVLQVRLSETDQNGVVYFSQYFVYFDVAKTEFLKKRGLNPITLGRPGHKLFAAETGCTFYAPARFGDVLKVQAVVRKVGRSSIIFDFNVKKNGKVVAKGYIVNVLVNTKGRPVSLPLEARKRLERYIKYATSRQGIKG